MVTQPTLSESDEDLFYAYVSDFLDEDLSGDVAERFNKLANDASYKEKIDLYNTNRGRLQLSIQPIALNEEEYLSIREIIQDKAAQQSIEAVRINQVERMQKASKFKRSLLFISMAVALVLIVYSVFTPEKEKKFNAIETVGYEAIAMIEYPDGRIDLPSNNYPEIVEYFSSHPAFEVKPKPLKPAKSWKVDGASIIDYDSIRVAVAQYSEPKSGEKLFHFAYIGKLSDLPKSEPAAYMGLRYQAYASDRINLIAWQHNEQIVSIVASRLSAETMAQFARQGVDSLNTISAPK